MPKLLVTYQTFYGSTKTLAEAVAEGAKQAGAEVTIKLASETNLEDMVNADAIVLASTQSFGSISADVKKLFERTWRDREKVGKNKPFGAVIMHTTDTGDSVKFLENFPGRFGLVKKSDWITVKAGQADAAKSKCQALGASMVKS